MPRQITHPIPLAEIDVDPSAFLFSPDTMLTPLSGGFNSWAFKAGSGVVKVSHACGTEEEMLSLARIMQGEHDDMADFIGDNMPSTEYFVASGKRQRDRARVVTAQDLIDGPALPEYMASPNPDIDNLTGFLGQCLVMRRRRGIVPDLANIQTGFNIFRNTNVVMELRDGGAAKPYLTDTNFGKIQRSKVLGPIWVRAISWGVRKGLDSLEQSAPTPESA